MVRRIPLAVRWLAVAAAAGVIGGGGWMYLNRTDEAVPGPSAQSASPASPTPSVTPTVTTSASPTTVTTPMDELGDYNPDDPVPAKADQLTIETPVTATGWGAYQLGMSEQAMKDRKLVVPSTTRCEGSLEAITAHKTVGLVLVDSSKDKGLWGFTVRNPMVFGRVRQGNHEIIFLTSPVEGPDTPATPSSVVTGMTVREYGTWWPQGAGC